MAFAENLSFLMREFNLSNYKLAKDLGCSQTTVANWISGSRMPHPKTQDIIADRFNISVAELTGEELPPVREQKEKPAHDVDELDQETIELREIWDSSDPDERQALLQMARLLKNRRPKNV